MRTRTATTPLSDIPAGVFEKRKPEQKKAYHNVLSRAEATRQILDESTRVLGVSLWRIAILLDLPCKSLIYHWGASEASISAFYLSRLTKLLLMKFGGVDFTKISCINWTTGEVILKDNEQSSYNVSGGQRSVSVRHRDNRETIPDTGNKQERRNEAHDIRGTDLGGREIIVGGREESEIVSFPRTTKYRTPKRTANANKIKNDL